jgi:S1-C subfamily serine protease
MPLAATVERVRSGVFQIAFLNAAGREIGAGSCFLSGKHLITNNHVFVGYLKAAKVWLRKQEHLKTDQGWLMDAKEFAALLVAGSAEQSYDYAILRALDEAIVGAHSFDLAPAAGHKVGEPIALLGFPLEHRNLTCHAGVISSFLKSGVADLVQVDASVNAGNSGGPLIDPENGTALGMITRKATGLSKLFDDLRNAIDGNLGVLDKLGGAGVFVGGLNPVDFAKASQGQMRRLLDEIERQANVGIGYAVSSEHLIEELTQHAV